MSGQGMQLCISGRISHVPCPSSKHLHTRLNFFKEILELITNCLERCKSKVGEQDSIHTQLASWLQRCFAKKNKKTPTGRHYKSLEKVK